MWQKLFKGGKLMFQFATLVLLFGVLSSYSETPNSSGSFNDGSKNARTPNRASNSEKWKFAGESHGIKFSLRISNECRPTGSSLAVKLENTMDYPVTVSFRINNPDWTKTFERHLGPREMDTGLKYKPDEGTVCHAYLDQIFVEAKNVRPDSTNQDQAAVEENE
jgi:hypothetical protein